MPRIFLLCAACGLLLAATACQKDKVAPTTGDLDLTFIYQSSYSGLSYRLYTESAWAGPNTAGPLRTGTLGTGTAASYGRLKSSLTVQGLNAGNYVVTLSSTSPSSVQVTAGQTNQFTLEF